MPKIPDKLLAPHEISSASMGALITAAEQHKFEVPWWRPRGLPAFDTLEVEMEGPAKGAGAMIDSLMNVPGLQMKLHLFPRGIIAIDKVVLGIEATGTART